MSDYPEVYVVSTIGPDDWHHHYKARQNGELTATPGFPFLVTDSREAAEQVAEGSTHQWGAAPFMAAGRLVNPVYRDPVASTLSPEFVHHFLAGNMDFVEGYLKVLIEGLLTELGFEDGDDVLALAEWPEPLRSGLTRALDGDPPDPDAEPPEGAGDGVALTPDPEEPASGAEEPR